MSTEPASKKWEDIVFENRNKAYGAYFIRMIYSKHVVIASVMALLLLSFVLAYPAIANLLKSDDDLADKKPKITKVSLEQPPPITPDQPPPPDIPPPPVKTIIKFLPPKVTEKEVVEEEKMPTIEEIKKNETGSENVEGDVQGVFEEPVQEVVKDEGDGNKIFNFVEQSAEFPGGMEAFAKFLQKNLRYPPSASRMGLEGRVFVKFVVEPDGSISNPEVLKGFDAACDREALRVIKLVPRWKPGKQGGRAVRSNFTQVVYFKLEQ